MDLSVNLAGINLKNPLVLASGIMGVSASSCKMVEKNGAGAVTLKSIGPMERAGHHNPTVFAWEHGIINAVGLSNPGIDAAIPQIKETMDALKIPVFVSIFADTIDNFNKVAEKVAELKPQLIEVNLSCPNTESDFGTMFAAACLSTEKAVTVVKKKVGKIKVFAKIPGDIANVGEIGKAIEAAGGDGITAINTVSSVIIDIRLRRPVLTNKVGGISGPAVKPIAVKAVYQLYKAVKLPIIGLGGVTTGEDAIEFIMAGATAVGVGSAIHYRGIDVFKKITKEMETFMKEEGIKNLDEIRGCAHC